jgi:ribonucleoside-triphosphate reductase
MEIKDEVQITFDTIEWAMNKVKRDFEQGFQGIEMKLNTVGSSRGDYPFITMTFGLGTEEFEKMASITFMQVHEKGQGKEGNKKPVLFPKLVFLYDEALHGEGCINYDVFNAGISCSAKTMYPDWLSLTGEGYVAEMYKKYGRVISPMGCRAFLSPWYERGGMTPADEYDKPVFVGRFNVGAVSLHLPMILAKARKENKDFYEVLDYYLEMIRGIHQRTYEYLGEMRASTNPIAYCEGGFLGGHLQPGDKIKPLLKPMTSSFGITALNELQELYNGKSLVEDGQFALEVMQYINDKVQQFKEEDGWLYAIYGTPAESLCGLQI